MSDLVGGNRKVEHKFRDPRESPNDVITLDLDYPITKFESSMYKALLEAFAESYPGVESIYIRKSSSGNIHVSIHLKHPVSFWDRVVIRAWLHDDPSRIVNDIKRFTKGEPIERLFSTKGTDGVFRHAGEWKKIFPKCFFLSIQSYV